MKKNNQKLGALLTLSAIGVVAVTPAPVSAASEVTIEDRQIPYQYKEEYKNAGVKFLTGYKTSAPYTLIDTEGEVYQWGTTYGVALIPEKVKGLPEGVIKVSRSDDRRTMLLTNKGEVYSYTGKVGNIAVPVKIAGLPNIVDIAAGSSDVSFAVTATGELYSWGQNSNKAIQGVPELGNFKIPKKIQALTDVQKVTVSQDGSIGAIINSKGELYTWGSNNGGILGHSGETTTHIPKKVEGLPPIKDISIGGNAMAAVTVGGELFTWGAGITVLGHGDGLTYKVPKKVEGLIGVTEATLASNRASAVLDTGELYVWGKDSAPSLGVPGLKEINIPTLTTLVGVKAVKNQMEYSQAITEDGTPYLWGSSDYVGLDGPQWKKYPEPTELVKIMHEANSTMTFKQLTDKAVQLTLTDVPEATNYTIKKNGVIIHNNTTATMVDDNVFAGVPYEYEVTIKTRYETVIKKMTYTHGEEPDFTVPETPEGETCDATTTPIYWSATTSDADYATTLIPEVTVMGGKPASKIKLNNVEYNFSEPIQTELGEISLESDGEGNTFLNIPEGLGDKTTDTAIDVEYEGTNFLKIKIKPSPVINFSFK